MHAFALVLALFAALALSGPINPRYIVTDLDIVTVTEWVTVPAPSSTGVNDFYRPSVDSPPAASSSTTTTTQAPVAVATPSSEAAPASSSSTVAAVVEPVPASSEAPSVATVAPASSSTTVAVTPTATSSGGSDLQSLVLDSHNVHRSNHSAPALVWDDDLASIAAEIASSCVYAHNTAAGGGGYGQNIGAGLSAADIDKMITDQMYNDEFDFYPQPFGSDDPDMTNFEKWGHLSQIVWKGTTSVGCAVQTCSSLVNIAADSGIPPIFTVCNYKPPGNVAGEYSNVGAPLGGAIVFA